MSAMFRNGIGPSNNAVDYTTYSDEALDRLAASYQANLSGPSIVNRKVYESWLAQVNAEKARRANSLEKEIEKTPTPPAIDLPGMESAAGLAAMKQRKRAQRASMLIEGQPSKETIAAGPAASLRRKSLVAY